MHVQQPSDSFAQSATSEIDLSIVLINWNGLEVTSDAVRTIETETRGITYEVFVVDNGSSRDASVTELPRRFPKIKLITNQENRGFGRANNQAVRRARGRYILILNNDTIQIENALGKAVEYMDSHEDLGALGITHLNNDALRTLQASFFRFPNPWRDVASLVSFGASEGSSKIEPLANVEQDVDWVVGSFLMMRRSCYEDVGELDERFFIYDEDIDWCLRAKRAGWKVRYWPGAKMIHLGSASRPFMKDKTFVHFRSHLSYIKKNHSLSAAVAYYAAMALRLSLATGKHAALFMGGRVDADALRERVNRERQFLTLRSGKTGG